MNKLLLSSVSILLLFSNAPVFAKKTIAPPNPFGPSVLIFEPTMDPAQINQTIGDIYQRQRYNEFGKERYVFMFMPGEYGTTQNIDVRVGYGTQVLGAGNIPEKVIIHGAVRTQDESYGALTNFWRGAENLAIVPTLGAIDDDSIPKDQNVWAVSQASPLRRIRIMNGSLRLYQKGYSSGGFLSESRIDGNIYSGTQQQWLTRNSTFKAWDGSNWNITFSGVFGAIAAGNWPNPPYNIISKTPRIRTKPYLWFDATKNQYYINIRTIRANVGGTDWHIPGTNIPIENFFIAQPTNTADQINQQLAAGKHLLLTPGVYILNDSLRVTKPNTIIFGLGLPTLVPENDRPPLVISDVDGVQVAGVTFDAGPKRADTLLVVGESKTGASHYKNPTSIWDAFCRVGGAGYSLSALSCFTINSNDVILDDIWAWRADHVANDGHLGWGENRGETGITVNGDNVIAYNLMAEHFQKYQTIWNGENGQTIHYQSEIPYDPPDQAAWKNGGVDGWASYKIGDNVNTHKLIAPGAYTYFRDAPVWGETAIEAPVNRNICIQHVILFWLNGNPNSGLRHVVNQDGTGVSQSTRRSDYTQWPGGKC